MLYPDEHERLVRFIKENGYKKVEYTLACIKSVKKTSMVADYKRFTALPRNASADVRLMPRRPREPERRKRRHSRSMTASL